LDWARYSAPSAIAAVSRDSFETIELFREVSARLAQEREATRLQDGNSQWAKIGSYIVELHVNQLADEAARRFFNSSPTPLQLPSASVAAWNSSRAWS